MQKCPYIEVIRGRWNKIKKQESLQVDKITEINEEKKNPNNCFLKKKKNSTAILKNGVQYINRPNLYLSNVSGILKQEIS